MGTFMCDGLAVNYLDEGAGDQAVVFVHGFPFQASMWDPQIPVAVEAGRRAVAPDLPGFGRSAVPAERSAYSIDGYADLVAALVGDLGLGQVVLVGLSMGGYIALAVARRHPEVLAGLVLADTRADPDTPEGRQTRSDQQALVEMRGDVTPLVDGLLTRVLAEAGPRRAEVGATLGDMMRSTAPAGWIGALEAMKQRRDQTDLLPSIAVPTLVVVGESDAIAPVDVAEAMAKAIPNAYFEVIPDAGHVANLENPEVFNRAFSEFLTTLLST
ncbi:MAG TPA: alpha/beta hydrolase [Acidimicrobiia bacterium]|jgi:pimeloyl-ACP methyl ester carboxylesterase|nr:alpha/beta hydrolase [Acidimicrobiia bacterium]